MSIIRKFHSLVLAASVLTGAAQHANADAGKFSININGGEPLYVVSNGRHYTQMREKGLYNVVAHLEYDTGTAGRIRGYGLTPRMSSHDSPTGPNLSYHSHKTTFPLGNRPRSIDKRVDLSFPMHEIEGWIVGLCNLAARTLRDKGLSNAEIFSKHQFLSVNVRVDYYVDATGAGDLFAAGFLAGLVKGKDLATCASMGCVAAGEVIGHIGARPEADLNDLMAERGL